MTNVARIITAAAALASLATIATAQAPFVPPFAHADVAAGKALYDKDCVGCHAQRMGGDASKMYTRADHKVKNAQQLLAQVRWCNTQIGAKYFPEDEENVAAYLNQQYYHFKP